MLGNGYSKQAVKVLWDTLMPFADYAFNKAHSAGYGVLSYWTAYLKANYPGRVHGGAADQRRRLQGQARDVPERVPPDGHPGAAARRQRVDRVTSPPCRATDGPGDIRFGLGAVRNVGYGVVDGIRAARERRAAFTTFHDFLRKVPIPVANKRTVESLIKAGAFDSLGSTRRALMEIHEEAVEAAVSVKRNEANGQVGFDFDSLWDEPEAIDSVPTARSGPSATSWRSSARCSGST